MLTLFKKTKDEVTIEKLVSVYKEIYAKNSDVSQQDIRKLISSSKLQYDIIYNAVKGYL